jgi:hypothetical protein
MKLELIATERLLVGQIVNIRLDSATLRDHIKLESIFDKVESDKVKIPVPPDYVPEEKKELFKKYENQQINSITDENDKREIQDAIQKARKDEALFWEGEFNPDPKEVEFEDWQLQIVKDFFEKDQRPFPRVYHKAILSLAEKLEIEPVDSEEPLAKPVEKKRK